MDLIKAFEKIDEMRQEHLEAIQNADFTDTTYIFAHLDDLKALENRKIELMKANLLYTMEHPVTIQGPASPKWDEEPEEKLTPEQEEMKIKMEKLWDAMHK